MTQPQLTWQEMLLLEPRLKQLHKSIKAIKDDTQQPYFCANQHWLLGGLKEELLQLVGWDSTHPDERMRSDTTYNTAYHKLYETLPDCRDCHCVAIER
jgi:hypothetical protein